MEIVEVVKQAAGGLVYLHQEQMLAHKNIKPANVLVRSRQPLSVVLTDLQIFASDDWQKHPHYYAPEVADDSFDAANLFPTDIWALGTTAMHVVLGNLPEMDDPFTYAEHTLHPFLHSPPSTDPLESLLRPMMALEPADRPDAAKCLANAQETLQMMTSTVIPADRVTEQGNYGNKTEKRNQDKHHNHREDVETTGKDGIDGGDRMDEGVIAGSGALIASSAKRKLETADSVDTEVQDAKKQRQKSPEHLRETRRRRQKMSEKKMSER